MELINNSLNFARRNWINTVKFAHCDRSKRAVILALLSARAPAAQLDMLRFFKPITADEAAVQQRAGLAESAAAASAVTAAVAQAQLFKPGPGRPRRVLDAHAALSCKASHLQSEASTRIGLQVLSSTTS